VGLVLLTEKFPGLAVFYVELQVSCFVVNLAIMHCVQLAALKFG